MALLAGRLAAKDPVIFNELKLEDGKVLKGAQVIRVEPDGLHISHKDGVAKVKFENLPENVQKQFEFDREEAAKYREEKDAAQEARDAEERREKVESLLSKQRAEQDEDVRRGREEFFALLGSGEYSYPQLDKILQDSIAALKEAGRNDLAATLEDDRKMLREREVTRPAESLRKERDQLAARVRDLELQLAQLNNKPADPPRDTAVVWPIFVDRPVIIPQTIVDPSRPCPPSNGNKPGSGNGTRPRLTPYSPGVVPVVSPTVPSITPVVPASPVIPATPWVIPNRTQPSFPRSTPQIAPPPAPAAPRFNPAPAPAVPSLPNIMPPPHPSGSHGPGLPGRDRQ